MSNKLKVKIGKKKKKKKIKNWKAAGSSFPGRTLLAPFA